MDIKSAKLGMADMEAEAERLWGRLSSLEGLVKSAAEDFYSREYVPFRVAEVVLKEGMGKLGALDLVHRALAKTQDILSYFKVRVVPDLVGISCDVKMILKTARVKAMHDEGYEGEKASQAKKEADAEFILSGLSRTACMVDRDYKRAMGYIDWVQEQYDYALRLESGVRLGERIEGALKYQGFGVNGTVIEI